MSLRRPMIAAVLVLLGACKETPVDPAKVPASIVAIDGLTQNGAVGAVVGTTPTFEVRNADGDPIAGINVTITVTAGGGTLTGKPSSSGAGPTAIGTWTLGPTAGAQTVTVSRGGLTPLVFTATAAAGAPAGVSIVSGNNQSAFAGAALANAVRASVVDGFGNALAGQTVNWDIVAGGGSLTGSTSTIADGAGLATAPAWTLGKNGGAQQLRASSGAFEAVATATIQSALVVDLRWVGTAPTGATLAAFTRAVDRIRATITGALGPVGMPGGFNNVNQCDAGMTSTAIPSQTITGVIIYAAVVPIDGAGNILGSAGPCLSRDFDMFKTALGTMRFDSADMPGLVADGRIDAVILHEMLHVMGVGTNWELNNLLLNPSTVGNALDTRFTGAQARAACAGTNGGTTTCATTVPVHNADGAGSINSHWRESTFSNELMTPFILAGGTNPMSAMTIQSLADIGYTVNPNTQDAFLLANLMASVTTGSGGATATSGAALRMPEPTTPVFAVDRAGRLRRLRELK